MDYKKEYENLKSKLDEYENQLIELDINGEIYKYNKLFLMYKSKYFEKVFTDQFFEMNRKKLVMNINENSKKILINFLNDVPIVINIDNWYTIYTFSEFMYLDNLLVECYNFFNQILLSATPIKLFRLYENYPHPLIQKCITRYITKEFIHIYAKMNIHGEFPNIIDSLYNNQQYYYKLLQSISRIPLNYFLDIIFIVSSQQSNHCELLEFSLIYLGCLFHNDLNNQQIFEIFDKIKGTICNLKNFNSNNNNVLMYMNKYTNFVKKNNEYFKDAAFQNLFG